MCKILVVNLKGGCGKIMVVMNLVVVLVVWGDVVGLVDVDW